MNSFLYWSALGTFFTMGCLSTLTSQEQAGSTEKQGALHQAVTWIPYRQVVEERELAKGDRRLDWMKKLSDELPVSLVSIPATHDAGTALGNYGWSRCQILTIPAQLAVGVRGFDIRLRRVNSSLQIYHSLESQKLAFTEVLEAYQSFLKKHPREFLIMRVREEAAAINPDKPFEQAFDQTISPYRNLFYRASSRTEIPHVGELRGKILILDNYGKLANAVDYPNPSMAVQDDYDTNDMEKKLSEIIASFELALGRKNGSTWDVNYTSSCTAKVDQIANARAVNEKVRDYLKGKKGNLGLVLFNFPSVESIHSVIDSNFVKH